MTREEIIDLYGFDPGNYTLHFIFHYFLDVHSTLIDFLYIPHGDKIGYHSHLLECDRLHNGRFRERYCSDLDYLDSSESIKIAYVDDYHGIPKYHNSGCLYFLLKHEQTGKFIVLTNHHYSTYFRDGRCDAKKGDYIKWKKP